MEAPSPQTLTFRCPPELEPILPRPIPAVLGLPDWFKTMPHKAFSTLLQREEMTVKKCPPVIDAMTCGFLIPLVADLRVEDGMLSWDRDVPAGALTNYSRSPIDFHDNHQVTGTPFYEEDRFLIKFANYWLFELPAVKTTSPGVGSLGVSSGHCPDDLFPLRTSEPLDRLVWFLPWGRFSITFWSVCSPSLGGGPASLIPG